MANRALLIGINNYPQVQNRLTSCIADTVAFKQLLQAYGFSDDNVQMLHDDQATLDNARNALDWLVAEASADDRLVFFESSHGYRKPKDDGTMVEMLCLYDGFLEDHELVSRTQGLPSGILTVVLDACFSGGMNKLFFPGGQVQVARTKVFQPDPEQALQDAKALQNITRFKSFGHAPSQDAGVVIKAFAVKPEDIPLAKAGADLELDGLLFSACTADQTAAAGSPATDGLSAFTYGLTNSYRTGIISDELRNRTEQRLRNLGFLQTPRLEEPAQGPDLISLPFVTMQSLGTTLGSQLLGKDNQQMISTTPLGSNTTLSLLAQQMADQMNASGQKAYNPVTSTLTDTLNLLVQQIANQAQAGGQKAFTFGADGQQEQTDAIKFASLLAPSLAKAVANKKTLQTKAMPTETFTLSNPRYLQDKAWWNDVIAAVEQFTPYIAATLSGGKSFEQDGLASVRPEHLQDKAWWNDVINIAAQVGPSILNAISGNKDYKLGGASADAPVITISPEHINDKAWYDDVLKAVGGILPALIVALA